MLVALAGARLAGVAAGLAAGTVVAVAFLPVFYSHLALNDVPAMAAVALALWAAARVLDRQTLADHAIAGAAVGLAAATKYTAGIALLAVLIASKRPKRLLVAAAAALLAFLVACPNALTDTHRFLDAVTSQSGYSGRHKLGLTETNGYRFYLDALTWGLGWAPLVAAVAGAVVLVREDRRKAALLIVPPLVYLLYMGDHERFFGRWLLPALPFLAVLAGAAVARLPRRLVPLGVAALAAQGLVLSVMSDHLLSKPDTRNETRAWLRRPRPARHADRARARACRRRGARRGACGRCAPGPRATSARWRRACSRPTAARATAGSSRGRPRPAARPPSPAASRAPGPTTPRSRARRRVPFRAAPWSGAPVAFDYERSFTYRPPGYDRPGEEMTVHRLHGCRSVSSNP